MIQVTDRLESKLSKVASSRMWGRGPVCCSVMPDVPGFAEVLDAERLDVAEVPVAVLVPEPRADGTALGEVGAGVVVGHGEIPAADAGGADHERDGGVENDLLGADVVEDVVLVATLLVDEAHLHDLDAIDDGRVGKDGGGDVGTGADDKDGEAIGFREGAGNFDEEVDGSASLGAAEVLERQAAALDEGRVDAQAETLLDDLGEDAEGGVGSGRGQGWSVRGQDAEHVEAFLQEEVGDGPLIVDLVSDVGGEHDRSSGVGGVGGDAEEQRGGEQAEKSRPAGHGWVSGRKGIFLGGVAPQLARRSDVGGLG